MEPDKAPFPWGSFFTALAVVLTPLVAALGGFWALLQNRYTTRKTVEGGVVQEEIKAGTTKGQQANEAQKQRDAHDETLLGKFLERIDKLEKAMDEERRRCVDEIKEVRNQHADCMKLHAETMAEIGQLRARTDTTTQRVSAGLSEGRRDREILHERVAKVESVIVNSPPPQNIAITTNVGDGKAAEVPPGLIVPEDIHK